MFNPFEGKEAQAFVGALIKGRPALLKQTIDKALKKAKASWLDNSKQCDEALVAATIVSVARGQPGKIPVPDEITGWLSKSKFQADDALASTAAEVVDYLRTNSMAQEIVDDGGWPGWKTGCSALSRRLREPAKAVKLNGVKATITPEMSPAAARKALEKKRARFEKERSELSVFSYDENALGDAEAQLISKIPEITAVGLRKQSVTDEGVKSLASLPNLKKLDLGRTQVKGPGLKHLSDAKKLVYLSLNGIATDSMLAHAVRLAKLKKLDLYYSKQLTDKGLAHLSAMTLEDLSLGYTACDGSGLKHLDPSKLRVLDLRGTTLSNEGAKQLARFTAVEELNLGSCTLASKHLAALAGMKKLCVLMMDSVKGVDDGMHTHLGKCTSLQELKLSSIKSLTGKKLGALTSLTKLVELKLSGSTVTGEEVGRLGELPKLKELDLEYSQASDDSLASLAKSKSIAVLSLKKTNVTSAGVAHLAKMKSLRELNLMSTKLSDDIADVLLGMTWLKELDITFTGITPPVARKIRKGLKADVSIDP